MSFAMALSVAQIGMFVGRPLPVPARMFTAVLVADGVEAPIAVSRVRVLAARDDEVQLELVGTVSSGTVGFPYAGCEVTIMPTVSITA